MYLKNLGIIGYRTFEKEFQIEFSAGLNILVGENGCGKTTIIDAIRELLLEDEFGRSSIVETDFFRPFSAGSKPAKEIKITATFGALKDNEPVAFMPWVISDSEALLTLYVENKESSRGRYKRTLWGGASRSSVFERELFDKP
jgi:predicted ATP-dependent endonuclease of OLD family